MANYYTEEPFCLEEIDDEIPVTWNLIGEDRLVNGDPLAYSSLTKVEDFDEESGAQSCISVIQPPPVVVSPLPIELNFKVKANSRKRQLPPKRTAVPSKRTKVANGNNGHSSSLKSSQPTTTVVPPSSVLSSSAVYKNEKAFWKDMDKVISSTIDEALCLLNLDPRRYHPYYLRIFKYITIGQQQGYIQTPEKIMTIWKKYDKICMSFSSKAKRGKRDAFTGEVSPYATFLKTGKVFLNGQEVKLTRNEKEIHKKIQELENVAKTIVKTRKLRKTANGNAAGQNQIINDLQTRLEFFEHCKTVTFPSDCEAMNKIWDSFLYEFEKRSSKSTALLMEEALQPTSSPGFTSVVSRKKKKTPEIIEIDSDPGCASNVDETTPENPVDRVQREAKQPKYIKRPKPGPLSVTLKRQQSKRSNKEKTENSVERVSGRDTIRKTGSNNKDLQLSKEIKSPTSDSRYQNHNITIIESAPLSSKLKRSTMRLQRLHLRHHQTSSKTQILCKLKKKSIQNVKKKGAMMKTMMSLEKMLCTGKTGKLKIKSTTTNLAKLSEPKTDAKQVPQNATVVPPPPQNQNETSQSATLISGTVKDQSLEPHQPLSSSNDPDLILEDIKKKTSNKKLNKAAPTYIQANGRSVHMCDECGKMFYNGMKVLEHKHHTHGADLPDENVDKCPVCQKNIVNWGPYSFWFHFHREHTITGASLRQDDHENGEKEESVSKTGTLFTCDKCTKSFANRAALHRHIFQMHGDGSRPFQCSHCGKMFKTNDTMGIHVRQVHLGETFGCNICNRKHQTSAKLWKHKVDDHGLTDLEPPPGTTLQQCEVCGERMLRGLLQHVKKKHPNHEFAQNYESFLLAGYLKNLKEIRARQKEKRQMRLKTAGHKSRDKEYSCPAEGCNRIFYGKQNMERHIFSHYSLFQPLLKLQAVTKKLGQKEGKVYIRRWICEICEEELKGEYAVTIHFLVKHPQIVEKGGLVQQTAQFNLVPSEVDCPHCEEKLASHKELQNHIKQGHSEHCCQCPECEGILTGPEDLQEHFFLEHRTPGRVAKVIRTVRRNKPKRRKKFGPHKRKGREPGCMLVKKSVSCQFCDSEKVSKKNSYGESKKRITKSKARKTRPRSKKRRGRVLRAKSVSESVSPELLASASTDDGPRRTGRIRKKSAKAMEAEEVMLSEFKIKPDDVFKCDMCNITYPSSKMLAAHRKRLHNS